MNRFGRADVLRILHITAQQLAGWQRAGLVPNSDDFTFFDLIQLRKVRELRSKRVRPAVIRQSLLAMQRPLFAELSKRTWDDVAADYIEVMRSTRRTPVIA